MKTLTPAEMYEQGRPKLVAGIAALLEREESAADDIERGIATALDALTTIATAYIERTEAVQRERVAAGEAADAFNNLAASLDLEADMAVPPSRVPMTGPAGAVHRAAGRGVAAVVFELAALVAERAAKEM